MPWVTRLLAFVKLDCMFLRQCRSFLAVLLALPVLISCGKVWNDPYPAAEQGSNTLYSAFSERPKHLDPVQSYAEDEVTFTGQIYEPPLQYHYLKRPYTLIAASAQEVPVARLFDRAGRPLAADAPAERVARSVYEIKIKPGIRYQPHPAFALAANGQPYYGQLDRQRLQGIKSLNDFNETGSRELTADDFIYEIKRLAHPRLHSPIFGMMVERIVGLDSLAASLQAESKRLPGDAWLDLDRFALDGAKRIDRYTYQITIKGKYPQFLYWLAMPFFAPIPREVDRFYSQPGMAEKNLTLDWWPVGTGPYLLSENNPNSRMVLTRNPNYHGDSYPCEGEAGDQAAGLLADCGKALPLIDQAVFTREKESIPYWNKFLQGYYDASGIASENFDQAVRVGGTGEVALSEEMQSKGIRLLTGVRPSIFYIGFNMQDPLIGAAQERNRKLRQAISIAIDQEEFISIFMNGRGQPAHGPLPPGIFGYQDGEAGINEVVYQWRDGQPRRRSIGEARALLAEAGWPNGRHAVSGEPLVINLDTTAGGLGEKSRLDWLVRQFAKLDIQLVVRATDWNRFQEKVRKGSVQLFYFGWNADYPDPENFFFLLHGPQARTAGGENSANYSNPEYDRLFDRMKSMDNGPERLALIQRMTRLAQQDAPWVFCFYPTSYTLAHAWLMNRKPMEVGNNGLKYQRLDIAQREQQRQRWNVPVLLPLLLMIATLVLAGTLLWRFLRRRAQEG